MLSRVGIPLSSAARNDANSLFITSLQAELLFTRCQSRHAIDCMIFEVELVSKLMKDNVLTVGGISRAVFDGAPGEDQRTHSAAGLAKATHSPLLPNMLTELPFFFHHVCQWINKNREQTWEIIRLAMQQ